MTRDDPAAFVPPPSFGPFRVLHQIGIGALGPVFRTYEPTRDRLVAVKVFRLDVTPEQARTLADELARAGLKVAVYPVQSLFIAYKAVRDMIKELKATGTIANWTQRTPTWEEFNEFIGAAEATTLAERYRIV
jgi:2-methylisocitrate lyase-like PEP mutase family enzyme